MYLNEILQRIANVKKQGNEYTGRCPAHDDKQNSLSIGAGEDGKILLYDHAGCSTEKIVAAMGLTLSDLYTYEPKQEKRIVAVYQYKNLEGNVVHETVRYDPKDFRQRRPDGKSGYIYSLKGIQTLLYNLPTVHEAIKKGDTIYITEGEKDCDNMGKLGLTATTSPMGAGKWQDHYSDYLINSIIVIIPDNDTVGKSHSEQVAKSLQGKAKSIKVIDLTKGLQELPQKGDITDFFKKLGRNQGIEALKRLVNDTKEWNPLQEVQQVEPQQGQDNKLQTVDARTLSNMALEATKYVISSIISVGLHLLAGAPKLGKSWLIIWMCLQIARGRQVWGHETTQGTALYLCLEDNLNRIQSRMNIILHGEDAPGNVHFAMMAKSINDGLIQQIDEWMLLHPDTRIVAIDTLQKIRGGNSGNNAYADDYKDAGQLKQLADKHGIAILLVHHLRKMQDADVFNMVSGSTGLTGCVDSTFVIKKEGRQSQEATLYATGRDIEEMELLLSFNKSICTWELISTDAESFKEEQEFNENPVVIAVKNLLKEQLIWEGYASELLVILFKYCDGDLPTASNKLTQALNKIERRLLTKGISYHSKPKQKGTFITLSQQSPQSPQSQQNRVLEENQSITTSSPQSPLENISMEIDGDSMVINENSCNTVASKVCGGSGDNGDSVQKNDILIGDEAIDYLRGVI